MFNNLLLLITGKIGIYKFVWAS